MRVELSFELDLDADLDAIGSDGSARALLLGILRINGVPHHLQAIAVSTLTDGEQEPVDPESDRWWTRFREADEPDGPWMTVPLLGRDYCLIVTPHCA